MKGRKSLERVIYTQNFRENGVTLIALVITIAVLIILAAVSIKGILDQRGITKEAQKAKEMTENAVIQEDEDVTGIMDEYYTEMATLDWNLDKVTAVKSEDNILVPVPKGYTASTISGERSVSTGFVIKEGSNGAAISGINEFVWVPVPNISDIYDAEHNAGQLWDFGTSSSPKNPAVKRTYPTIPNSGYREPDLITAAIEGVDSSSGSTYDADTTYLQQAGLSSTATAIDFKNQLQTEFNSMIESVKEYGGFYIGRYESSANGSVAIVQKNKFSMQFKKWYEQYKLNKTIKANENVTTSMIWGCQWDATMRWMQSNSDSETVRYITNSTGKGKHNEIDNNLVETGSIEDYAVNNIYDMAGNVDEWTIEAYSGGFRQTRGGGCITSAVGASWRNGVIPAESSSYPIGSRATLYINS